MSAIRDKANKAIDAIRAVRLELIAAAPQYQRTPVRSSLDAAEAAMREAIQASGVR